MTVKNIGCYTNKRKAHLESRKRSQILLTNCAAGLKCPQIWDIVPEVVYLKLKETACHEND